MSVFALFPPLVLVPSFWFLVSEWGVWGVPPPSLKFLGGFDENL